MYLNPKSRNNGQQPLNYSLEGHYSTYFLVLVGLGTKDLNVVVLGGLSMGV